MRGLKPHSPETPDSWAPHSNFGRALQNRQQRKPAPQKPDKSNLMVETPLHAAAIQVELTRGTLTLEAHVEKGRLDELFGFAERRNPRRSFLFVSKVLGRHIPVRPSVMRDAVRALAARVPEGLPGPVVVIGMAETAIALGASVHRELCSHYPDSLYLCTTRHPVNADILARFEEEHSHATQQVIHWPEDARHRELLKTAQTLVLVDDEATTGKTFQNLIAALQAAGLTNFRHIVAATLADWSNHGIAERLGPEAHSVSLIHGRWSWERNERPPLEMPQVDILSTGAWDPATASNWGRLGVVAHTLPALAHQLKVARDEKILVLGTGEFVWPPLLLAEHLEQQGAQVFFSATTRSPIAVGHSIETQLCFTDNYGIGIPNFLYNVKPGDYDRIFLCTETAAHLFDPALLGKLKPTCLEFSA